MRARLVCGTRKRLMLYVTGGPPAASEYAPGLPGGVLQCQPDDGPCVSCRSGPVSGHGCTAVGSLALVAGYVPHAAFGYLLERLPVDEVLGDDRDPAGGHRPQGGGAPTLLD